MHRHFKSAKQHILKMLFIIIYIYMTFWRFYLLLSHRLKCTVENSTFVNVPFDLNNVTIVKRLLLEKTLIFGLSLKVDHCYFSCDMFVLVLRFQTRQKVTNFEYLSKIKNFCKEIYTRHTVWSMYKYEMDLTRPVGATKRTRAAGQTDGRDRRTDGVKPIRPEQLRSAG